MGLVKQSGKKRVDIKKSGHLLFFLLFHQLALTSLSLAMSGRREGQRGVALVPPPTTGI